jgi:membrane-bound serine protease (ClpP class)
MLVVLVAAGAGWVRAGEVPGAPGGPVVYVIKADGVVFSSMVKVITEAIRQTERDNAEALVIELDTPGGLVSSMQEIVKEMLAAKRPVVVYVSPNGASAGSAGAFITLAAHVAAMAPVTNIGASTPVTPTREMSKIEQQKAIHDLAAYMRTIAERYGRNVKVAEEWVREGTSKTAKEALEQKVIDLIAPSLDELVAALDGRTVATAAGQTTLRTKGARVQRIELSFRDEFLKVISSPTVAFILLLLAAAGLYFEFTTPGAILPGVVGAICLILALYSFHALPINTVGLLLMLLAIVLFIAEVKVISHGILTIGGVIAMIAGGLMLVDSPEPYLRVSVPVVVVAALATAGFFLLVVGAAVRSLKRAPTTGREGLIGEVGVARSRLAPEGQVLVHGELWRARCDGEAEVGDEVRVTAVEGLRLQVEKVRAGAPGVPRSA